MYNFNTTKQGFTMIEMMVAVFIFTLALVALMNIAAGGLKSSRESQNQVIAEYLALEAVEGARNIRDTQLVLVNESTTWDDIFDQDNCLSSGGNCSLILSGSDITLRPCNSCEVFYHPNFRDYKQFVNDNPGTGYEDTAFTRRITLNQLGSNPDEIIMEVFVEWSGGSVSYAQDLYLWL
tara:strand:+ start:4605 stop:5141 length:537 start_codon:yes stop_codon:yes gene_type:complete